MESVFCKNSAYYEPLLGKTINFDSNFMLIRGPIGTDINSVENF
jgi:hypothetical protein